jgi:hypothetical protein
MTEVAVVTVMVVVMMVFVCVVVMSVAVGLDCAEFVEAGVFHDFDGTF